MDRNRVIHSTIAGISTGALMGVLSFVLRHFYLAFNFYIMPGLLLGEVCYRLVGSRHHIFSDNGTSGAFLPVIILSSVFWAALVGVIIFCRSWEVRGRLMLALLSVLWLYFFAFDQLTQVASGLSASDGYPFPFRSFSEGYFYLTPVFLFLFLILLCFPFFGARVPGWGVVIAAAIALPALMKSYSIGNLSGVSILALLITAALAFFVCRSERHRPERLSEVSD